MEIHYLSWLRNAVGTATEILAPPPEVTTPQQLVDWLSRRDAKYAALARHQGFIAIAVNNRVVEDWNSPTLQPDDSVSFFSPLAGG